MLIWKDKFTTRAKEEYEFFKQYDKQTAKKISALILNTIETPTTGLGKPEKLKHELTGYWSRRITTEHRLVYQITEDTIIIISCRTHYK